jgi:hypothetical protein
MKSTLTQSAMNVLNAYVNLSTKGHNIPCPYYNNKRQKVRGALRVLVGKGSPSEIVQEAHMIALRTKVDLKKLKEDEVQKFLVENNLGIDCSAFVYYVLQAELTERKNTSLSSVLKLKKTLNPVRKFLQLFRHAENTNVLVLADDRNSTVVNKKDVQAGDMIITLDSDLGVARNHVLLIHKVEGKNIHYTHSLQWNADGKYEHGVRQGAIKIVDEKKCLTEQEWTEKKQTGEKNETLQKAKNAKTVEIRRLNAF